MWEIAIVFWIPRGFKAKTQYLAGLAVHVVWSPVLTQIVLFYSLMHCDDFKWGKTREVIEDTAQSTSDLEKGVVSNTVVDKHE